MPRVKIIKYLLNTLNDYVGLPVCTIVMYTFVLYRMLLLICKICCDYPSRTCKLNHGLTTDLCCSHSDLPGNDLPVPACVYGLVPPLLPSIVVGDAPFVARWIREL